MNLAWHQFRKDVRQFRWLLLGLTVILIMDLVRTQGWMEKGQWVWPFDSRNLHHFGINWIVGALIGGCGVMSFGTVMGDSPYRENAFIRTRPMPASSLWLGKGLFLISFVLVPLVLIETVNMYLHDCDWALVGAATWERFTLVFPVLVIITVISAASKDQKFPAIAVAVGYVAGVFGVGVIALVHFLLMGGNMNPDVDATSIRWALFIFAMLATIFALWEIRVRPRPVLRWFVFGVVVIISEWCTLYAPTNPIMPGLAQTEITEQTRNVEPRLPLDRIGHSQGESKAGMVSVGWTLSPVLDGLPHDWVVRWQDCTAELRTANGETHHAGPYSNNRFLPFPRYYNLSEEDMRSIGGQLPEGVMLEAQSGMGSRRSMNYRPFDLPPRGEWRNGPADLTVRGNANVYQWKQVADLELKHGASAKDGLTQWRIMGKHVQDESLDVVFEQEGIGLMMSADQQLKTAGRWPANRYEFIIYDPINKLARGIDHRVANSGSVGTHTGWQRRTAILHFREGQFKQRGWVDHPEALRLLVFRMDFLGTFAKEVATTIDPRRYRRWYGSNNRNADRISREDYLRRLAELEFPPANAPRTVVGNFVHSVLQLVDAHRRSDENNPGIRSLALLAPQYPEVFLDGYVVAESDARRALFEALRQGLRADQKSLVIDRLNEHPVFADLLVKRGWHDDAREELLALVDYPSTLPQAALKALASFNDPRADARLLREVRESRGESAYQIAERLPRLKDRLDAIVAERWNQRPKFHRTSGSGDYHLTLAINHGNVEAVREFVRRLSLHNPDRGSY
ncbi:MAG: hypothetical protein ACPGVU_25080, partial [Limisphaerales bacterium]